nr:putative toxin-antitoxin system toxin component, PIN family [Puniceicoccus vermicola]
MDTNVLISGLLSPHNPPGRIVDAIRSGDLVTVVDDRILSEYRAVLRRPYFERYIHTDEREWIIDFLTHESQPSLSSQAIQGLPDPRDACFLEIAKVSKHPLVTGNIKHFPPNKRRGVHVYSPQEYCQTHGL